MTFFLFSLAGIPPLAGWVAKFYIFRSVLDAGNASAVVLGVVVAVNSVIALFYYAAVAREMWTQPVPDDDRTPIRVPPALNASLVLASVVVLVAGVYPNALARFGEISAAIVR
jgi:NADH-quinone oxidoreductase subunit N